MDKQYHQINKELEKKLPVKFSKHDKQRVFNKIKLLEEKKHTTKPTSPYFKPKFFIALGAVIMSVMISIIFFTDIFPHNQFAYDKKSASESAESKMDAMMDAEEDADMYMERYDATIESNQKMEKSSVQHSPIFHPDNVEKGQQYGNMTISDVVQNDAQTIITFTGNIALSGTFTLENGALGFITNHLPNKQFPLTEKNQNQQTYFFHFINEQEIKDTFHTNNLLDAAKQIEINISSIKYTITHDKIVIALEASHPDN